jgi:hypothetical protein
MELEFLSTAEINAQIQINAWIGALAHEPSPYAHEFAKEASCIYSMYNAREGLRWMEMQTATWLMLASGSWHDRGDYEHF